MPKYYFKFEDSRQRDQIKQALGGDLLTRSGYLLDRQINAIEKKHQREGGYNEKLLQKRLIYRRSQS